ncbi:DUF2975 domain-containing protein [Olsenella sp. YH-ols2217]|uniref:DUF2975 domain-containing protein n=1 Tax=Kribbibacterium absianum TaxID=3044210 RepID=A0ABT6ZLL8_9ACTN|nr:MULTISPECIES: DUF2975 domain-containing protein [unclassified Olsenella]MDJ1121941.1 DUF2975 domain-containing protein [Olsenella sp. YH-ols2216]MDJ1129949.1 DUF2975 domain-containing protein [Olsenella sp. YH-ols2217]
MKNYSKPVSIIAMVVQILLWVGTALVACALIWTFVVPEVADSLFVGGIEGGSIEMMGVSVEHVDRSLAAFRTILGYGVVALGLSAMVARNITLISRSLAAQPEFSETNTPFTPDNVRMVREIGLFCVSISLWGLVATWVIFGVSGGAVETSWSQMGLLLGLVVLWLSTMFAYGHRLQDDVEGLV